MSNYKNDEIKYKNIVLEDFIINLDRLTRFKIPSQKYFRVFKDILSKYLISPKYSKKQIDELDSKVIRKLVEYIWNNSLKNIDSTLCAQSEDEYAFFPKYFDNLIFKNIDKSTQVLMNSKLKLAPLLKNLSFKEKLPKNLDLLVKYFCKNSSDFQLDRVEKNLCKLRNKYKTKFPISKLVLTEGITEEILLPSFAKKLKYDFDKEGVFVLGSGGKSKIPALYSLYKKSVKLPILILLDSDATEIYEMTSKILDPKDKLILINKGEFEDIVSKNLIKRSLNNYYYDIEYVSMKELCVADSMCENIAQIHKIRGLGEFQKANFAKVLAENITYKTDISIEIQNIIEEIKFI